MTPDLEADKKKAMTKEPQDAVWDDPQQPQERHQHCPSHPNTPTPPPITGTTGMLPTAVVSHHGLEDMKASHQEHKP